MTNIKNSDINEYFKNKHVLVTGGLGFLGSNLCRNLLHYSPKITTIDNQNALSEGRSFNICNIACKLNVVCGDVLDTAILTPLVLQSDLIYHLACPVRQVENVNITSLHISHSLSILKILEICRLYHHRPLIIFASSWLVYGKSKGNKIKETSATHPITSYGLYKLISEEYCKYYYETYGIPFIIFRISNLYGPRQQIKYNTNSMIGWYIKRAMENSTLPVFGDGCQLRNYIYISDLIEGMTRCIVTHKCVGEIINIGSESSTPFREMVETIISVVGLGRIDYATWPSAWKKQEPGDLVLCINKLKKITGWCPLVGLKTGIQKTWKYYVKNIENYL
ncbi:MAG: NAD-dependent epimerase/dehydratase family protein [Clostridia bacterium]|nr:NAD-dependent epimerase/dehydratase family protein [Clostridia bacterium]